MKKRTVDRLRHYYEIPDDVTDTQIEKNIRGSLGEALVNIELAKQDLTNAFCKAIPSTIIKWFKT